MIDATPIAEQGPFEFSGGRLCLDFTNTWGDRGRPETDQLKTYEALVDFARQAGTLDPSQCQRLQARAQEVPAAGESAVSQARGFREALYGIFSGRARGRPASPGDLACVNRTLRQTLPFLQIEVCGMDLQWSWREMEAFLSSPLWPVARSASELLTSGELAQVRECDGERCTWLFLDHSRSRSRRWCSMASCGNRAKARRHYQRKGPD